MRFNTSMRLFALLVGMALLLSGVCVFAQETTGGLQGTIKDASGAVVAGAHVVVTGANLAGSKALDTDSSGYYRFANLAPGTYTITATAKNFKTVKREGVNVEIGHLPTLDLTLEVGTNAEVVEVTGAAPVIDVTTTTNQTNLTSDVLQDTPHGYSFQSVIQFAPMARAEPLSGNAMMAGGNGGALPGSSSNGFNAGYMIGGAADSESSYLVEGQDTEDISGGASRAQVPFDFIQEVQVKTSGIEAAYGGALGGVVNVVMKKGSNQFHGSLFGSYESDSFDGSPNGTLRTDPLPTLNIQGEADTQTYQPKKDHYRYVQPGFTIGGPLKKDRLWFFAGFEPFYQSIGRTVNFGPAGCFDPTSPIYPCPNASLGKQLFTQDLQQYYGTARLDATLTSKIRVFGSWLYQYQRESGVSLPGADDVHGLLNTDIFSPLTRYSHGLGFSQPNSTYNFGADITLTPRIVSTTRFGYFFNNYHDFGWPTSGVDLVFDSVPNGLNDNLGNPYPAYLASAVGGQATAPHKTGFTEYNASKHDQFDEDVAFFKGGWWGTHNIKAGYQFNRLWNVINQHGNIPEVFVNAAPNIGYGASTAYGTANCGTLGTVYMDTTQNPPTPLCAGEYGYVTNSDFATVLKNSAGKAVPAIDHNHALFIQDAWTIGHGLTLNLGLRVEKESLPVPPGIGTPNITTIKWSWSDKIEPRLGAAWGSRNGKMKIFGSYGVVNDVMKLLLAQTSFGAQGWDQCSYPLGPDANGTFVPEDLTFIGNAAGRACPTGPSNTGATFAGGVTPTSLIDAATNVSLLENTNFRPEEPVAPGVKPYRQHEYVAGWDYQIKPNLALEVRYDRRRLDHVIEDASLADIHAFEIYTIVNPGQGVNKTLNGYANFLTNLGAAYGPGVPAFNAEGDFGTCTGCPNNPEAVRNYDGVEVKLTKTTSHGWAGMVAYDWSSQWGNYTGLTTTDQIDGGAGGRNSPDTTRAFDEPFYYFTYKGTSANGPLPTDRPNTVKGNVYYTKPWKGMNTTIGLFQVAYQGSPVSSWADVGYGNGGAVEGTYIWGRGNWVDASVDPSGNTILGGIHSKRTPWYTQTDLNLTHAFKVNKNNEAQQLSFTANVLNLFNQHAVIAYWQGVNSDYNPSSLFMFQPFLSPPLGGAGFYQQVETGYNPQTVISTGQPLGIPIPLNAQYGQPNQWQITRNLRLAVKFTW
ncbi:MAG TPA: TonB-dependent receptor [Candidatus Sulfotelmatobacter sp.]|nr:TonB-dependent receptor [Candidatus Sulfotelmatobacter sp.]